jgi:two-component system cell cycle sensor histidine kinase/response regulator CckA
MENHLHILVVEDNESDAALIIKHLTKTDFSITYEVVDSPNQLESALRNKLWDTVICDYSLPQFDAIQALKLFQSFKIDIPFIVVSGTVGEETVVKLMKAGAHDYIMKDNLMRFSPVLHRELLEAKLRREHKHAEEKILIQCQLLDLIGQSVIMIDKTDTITYWNKASEVLYGWLASEVIGLKFQNILIDLAPQVYSPSAIKSMKFGNSWTKEMIVSKKDNASIPVHVTFTPILDENNELKEIIGISIDISERWRAEEVMIKKMEELATSNEELNRINHVTVGREMRMIELKQHCNSLASQLGIDQPFPLAFINETDHKKTII